MLVSRLLLAPRASPVCATRAFSSSSLWKDVPEGGLDPIKALTETFLKDPHPEKFTLGEGVYRNEHGKPEVLESVREAEARLVSKNLDHEYAPVPGLADFVRHAQQFAFGKDCKALAEGRIASVQSLSGTGALRLITEFLVKFLPKGVALYQPTPTWANHPNIFKAAGMEVRPYRYYDSKNSSLDLPGMLEDLEAAPSGSVILLHACAHNPTGMDPSMEQWKDIAKVIKAKGHLSFFDSAYQGFASGDPVRDAASFRMFVDEGMEMVLAQSFAKNFGLYGERVGGVHMVCSDKKAAENVGSQLKLVVRAMYSNPPLYGARLVCEIFNDPALEQLWRKDLDRMASRMQNMRQELVENLKAAGSTRDWSHITSQIGMFAYSGLNADQVERMKQEFHIYMTKDGRMSISGINPSNVQRLAQAMHEVTK